jgi:hypothetical protein
MPDFCACSGTLINYLLSHITDENGVNEAEKEKKVS